MQRVFIATFDHPMLLPRCCICATKKGGGGGACNSQDHVDLLHIYSEKGMGYKIVLDLLCMDM